MKFQEYSQNYLIDSHNSDKIWWSWNFRCWTIW